MGFRMTAKNETKQSAVTTPITTRLTHRGRPLRAQGSRAEWPLECFAGDSELLTFPTISDDLQRRAS